MFTVRAHNDLAVLARTCLAELAAEPLPLLGEEIVLVQSRPLARWFEDLAARSWGIAAGLRCVTPRALIEHLGEGDPRAETWERHHLRWRLDPLLDRHAQDPDFAAVTAWLGASDDRARVQLLDRLADAFDTYQLLRPEWLRAWAAGSSAITHVQEGWQAALWRDLVADDDRHAGARLEHLLAELRAGRPPRPLPRRLTALGVAGLPPLLLDVLAALGQTMPVTLWLCEPTPHYWGDLRSRREVLRSRGRGHEILHADEGHPLLAALGRQGRRWFNAVQQVVGDGQAWDDQHPEVELPDPDAPLPILARLQADIVTLHIRDDDPLPMPPVPGANVRWDAVVDRSLGIHAGAGAQREVEIARDQVLLAFRDLPGLQPAEVLILTPDLDTYAPLVEAVFTGLGVSVHEPPGSRADPAAAALLALLELVGTRLERSRVLALAQLPAVREALAGVDIEAMAGWCERAGIRFGLDAAHRARMGLPAKDAGTWRGGLDRLLAGSLAGEVDLAGGFAACDPGRDRAADTWLAWGERLLQTLAAWQQPADLAVWAQRAAQALDGLLCGAETSTAMVRQELGRLATGQQLGCVRAWSAGAVAEALRGALDASSHGPEPRPGRIVCAGLKPFRAMPCRVLVLLGLDDAAFPRRPHPAPFDLIAADTPRSGDRQPREDDRQLFLEAILAVRDRLVITWNGIDARSGDPRPWSTCVDELVSAVDRTYGVGSGQALVIRHPLQPTAPAYAAGRSDLPTFASVPATAAATEPVFVTGAVPEPAAVDPLDLEDLLAFWRNPARGYLRRLGVRLPDDEAPPELGDSEPLILDALAASRLGADQIRARLAGSVLPAHRPVAETRLPLGRLGQEAWHGLDRVTSRLLTELGPVSSVAGGVIDDGQGLRLAVTFAHGGAQWRCALANERETLLAWIRHLAWNAWAQSRGLPGEGVFATRTETIALPAVPGAWTHLRRLVELRREGLCRPLPFSPGASCMAAELALSDHEPDPEVVRRRDSWQSEQADAWLQLAWRGRDLLTEDDFAELAGDVWGPYFNATGRARRRRV